MSIVCIVVLALAMWVEFTYEPPMWVHAALWAPLSIILSLILVRPLKGMMAALQYSNKAAEGRFR